MRLHARYRPNDGESDGIILVVTHSYAEAETPGVTTGHPMVVRLTAFHANATEAQTVRARLTPNDAQMPLSAESTQRLLRNQFRQHRVSKKDGASASGVPRPSTGVSRTRQK